MTTDTIQDTDSIYLHGPGEGRHLHVLDNLATLKTVAGGDQSMAVIEFTQARDFGPPLHVHRDEDEFLYVLEGSVDVQLDDEWTTTEAGTFVWLPRGVPHSFRVASETARMLSVTAGSGADGATFDAMIAALGTDVVEPTVPEPMEIDPGEVAMVCGQHGVDILGPPPMPASTPGSTSSRAQSDGSRG